MAEFDADGFAAWLDAAYMASSFKSYAELASRAGLSRSTLSAWSRARPQSYTNSPGQPKKENVKLIALLLGADPDEGLMLAGYAPETFAPTTPELRDIHKRLAEVDPETVKEVLEFLIFKQQRKADADRAANDAAALPLVNEDELARS